MDPDDYSFPIKIKVKSEFFVLDPLIFKANYILYGQNIVESDIGWLIENNKKDSGFNYYSNNKDFTLGTIQNVGRECFYNILISMTYSTKLVIRRYDKIQDVLAKIGGIIKAVFIIMEILFSYLFEYFFLNDVSNFLYCFQGNEFEASAKEANRSSLKNPYSQIFFLNKTVITYPKQKEKNGKSIKSLLSCIRFRNHQMISVIKRKFSIENIIQNYDNLILIKHLLLKSREKVSKFEAVNFIYDGRDLKKDPNAFDIIKKEIFSVKNFKKIAQSEVASANFLEENLL